MHRFEWLFVGTAVALLFLLLCWVLVQALTWLIYAALGLLGLMLLIWVVWRLVR